MIERGELLDLGSDLALRYRYFSRASLAHPAKLHLGLLAWLLDRYTRPGDTIADPMAGIGSTAYAALMQRHVILREIEPKWLSFAHENAAIILREAGLFAGSITVGQADARLPWEYQTDHVISSPPYACEMSSNTFRRQGILSHKQRLCVEQPGSAGSIQFHYGSHAAQVGAFRGDRYWAAMTDVYMQARAALRPGGHMILVIKDHIRRGQRVHVTDQTVALCESLGFVLVAHHARLVYPLSLWQRRRKERGELIVEEEDALIFTKAGKR